MEQIGKYISSGQSVPIFDKQDSIRKTIGKVESSHDPVFVYDGQEFIGIATPFQYLYKNKPALETKLQSILVVPPYLTKNSLVNKTVEQMLALRSYVLPVFDKNKRVEGIIKAKSVLSALQGHEIWGDTVPDKIVVMQKQSLLRDVFALMRKGKISRVAVVDEENQLSGIVGRRDIFQALMAPADKQRYNSKKGLVKQLQFDQDWETKMDYPLSNLQQQETVHTDSNDPYEWLKLLLENSKGSVVVTDKGKHPIGIVSTRTFLKKILDSRLEEKRLIEIVDRRKVLPIYKLEEISELLDGFWNKTERKIPISKIRIVIEAAKNQVGKPTVYSVRLHIETQDNDPIMANSKNNWEVRDGVREAMDEIEKQARRKH